MAVPGIRSVADARQRLMANPESQAAWAVLDSGFAAAADVFDECWLAAKRVIAADELPAFLEAARVIGKLGRGAEPLLAFLEHWPRVVDATRLPQSATLPAVMAAIRSLQKSPNGPAVTPLLQTLGAVAERLRTAEALQHYLTLSLDLAARTSGSIHGHHVTEPSPSLPVFFAQAPRLLGVVSLAGLKRWIDDGIRLNGDHPDKQRAYFNLESPESRAILQREREGTLFVDVERQLALTLQALWQDDSALAPCPTIFSERPVLPYLAADGLRLPDALADKGDHSGLARYRAMLAHLAGHRCWSMPLIADNWSPMQRMAVETLEDARIDALIMRRFPGLAPLLLALHPQPAENACDPASENCLRHRLICLSRACLDAAHGYQNPLLVEFAGRFRALLAEGAASTRAMADLALSYVSRSRQASDQFAKVHFADTEVDYRDDNRHLWTFIEAGDEEDSFSPPPAQASDEASGLPPRYYPEWDDITGDFRPDWCAVYEALHPAGNPADIDRLLEKHAVLARQLKRLLDLLKPQDRVRLRFQEDGSELDLDVAVRALVDLKSGHQPESRINVSHRTAGRDISVLLLIDLSQSLNATLPGSTQSILDTAREAVALLAWAIAQLGDACAIAGFHSNTRHEVRYHHIKGFSEPWDDAVKGRLAAVEAGWSTRMGAAIRHAGHLLSTRRSEKRILLILTDGEPADIDVSEPQHLIADGKKAVESLSTAGISTFCLSLDPQADSYVGEIFGQRWRVLDQIERLPETLPMVYLNLTR
ncbi:MAG: putative Rubisco activation protein CbbO [Rhodocyclaceae bacterium]|nr:MAG: putative Rubisco activation protein CbbO [Rhodocyclaceae bacterium]